MSLSKHWNTLTNLSQGLDPTCPRLSKFGSEVGRYVWPNSTDVPLILQAIFGDWAWHSSNFIPTCNFYSFTVTIPSRSNIIDEDS